MLKDLLRPRRQPTVQVRTIANGPFKGRRYAVKPDGSLGARLRLLPDGKVTAWNRRQS